MDSEEQTCGGCGKQSLVVVLTPQGAYCLLCYELQYPGPAPSLTPQRMPPAQRPKSPAPRPRPSPLSVRGCRSVGFEGIPGSGVRTQRDLFALALARSGRSFQLLDGPSITEEEAAGEEAIALVARPLSFRRGERALNPALPQIVILLQTSKAEAYQRLVDEGQGREHLALPCAPDELCRELEKVIEAADSPTILIRENAALPAQELHERLWSRCGSSFLEAENDP